MLPLFQTVFDIYADPSRVTLYTSGLLSPSVHIISFPVDPTLYEKFPGEFVWVNKWGSFNGDERALTREQINIANQRPMQPPPPQNLFIEFCKPIYGQMRSKVESYYSNL